MVAFVATSPTFNAWGLRAKQCLAAAVTGICQMKIIRLRSRTTCTGRRLAFSSHPSQCNGRTDKRAIINRLPESKLSAKYATLHSGHQGELVVHVSSYGTRNDGWLCPQSCEMFTCQDATYAFDWELV